ncbi:PIG-L family deacetylase [Virgibacillus salidurans]|uniref:PIG-L family deacetylase n=1 Tax=Virgibacillus salidurans TaxID=2831673 RepID=UPI00351D1B4F
MRKIFSVLFSVVLILSLLPLQSSVATDGQEEPDVDLWNAVKPLSTTVSFLNTGAHPDDERSDFLAYLSRGLGVQTSSLIANRGEGGQNEIGSELGNGLGIIRSNEMIEAAEITGVTAYHLSETTSDPIYDFGFSKSPQETLEKWGRI